MRCDRSKPPDEVVENWNVEVMDCECEDAWNLLCVIMDRLENGTFTDDMLGGWPTGTLHRMVMAVDWAAKLSSDMEDQGHQRNDDVSIRYFRMRGNDNTSRVRNALLNQLQFRKPVTNNGDREIWVTPFATELLDAMAIEQVANLHEVKSAFPDCVAAHCGHPIVCWKYATPSGIQLSNERTTMLHAHQLQHRPCNCCNMPAKYKDESGHVVTTDLSIIDNEGLRARMEAGTTFRGEYCAIEDDDNDGENGPDRDPRPLEIKLLEASIKSYIKKSSDLNKVPAPIYFEWQRILMDKLTERYNATMAEHNERQARNRRLDNETKRSLRILQKEYAILTADKAKNTYVIHCKKWLTEQVILETETTSTYKQALNPDGSPMQMMEIVEKDWQFIEEEGLAQKPEPEESDQTPIHKELLFHETVPTFGVVVKTIKKNKLRFLAKSHNTSLSQLSKWISRTLKLMMPMSEDVWTQLFRTGGMVTPGSWVITNSRQARQRMNRMQAMGKRPNGGQQTYDFATMYTQLKLFADPTPDPNNETESEDEMPLWEMRNRRRRRNNDNGPQHEDRDVLHSKMQAYTDLVFEYAKQTVKPYGEEKVLEVQSWGRSPTPWKRASADLVDSDRKKFVTRERIMKWIKYLLEHLYVKVGDKIYRQEIGVPMGTSCSPFLANLTLFMFEFEWFSEQISRLRPWHLRRREQLMSLAFCTRYIDDLWNPLVEETTFRAVTAQMYPEWLPLGEPEASGQEINYLDMSIKHNNNTSKWSSKLYDKREAMVAKGLKLNKFPHPESMLTSRCKYGVITSQLHRYNVACSSKRAFMVSAVKLYSDYLDKGYSKRHTGRYFSSFMRRHMPHCHPTCVQQAYRRCSR